MKQIQLKGRFCFECLWSGKRVLGGSRYVAGNTGTLELYAGVAGNVGAPVVCKRQIKPAILEQYDNFSPITVIHQTALACRVYVIILKQQTHNHIFRMVIHTLKPQECRLSVT